MTRNRWPAPEVDLLARLDHHCVARLTEIVPSGEWSLYPNTSPPFRGRTATPTLGNVYVSDVLRG